MTERRIIKFGSLVDESLKLCGMTRRDLMKNLKISKATLQNRMKDGKWDLDQLCRMADELKIPLDKIGRALEIK